MTYTAENDAPEGDSGASFYFAEESATKERKGAGRAQIFVLVAWWRKVVLLKNVKMRVMLQETKE